MTTNPKGQKAHGADPKVKPEELDDFQIPDRNYHHDDLQNPYTENIDEMGHDKLDNDWQQDIDEENGNQNGQNQDSVSEELEDED